MSLPAVAEPTAFGRYRLVERIGAGGMAIVYRARAEGPDGQSRELVIKRVLPELSRDPSFSSMLVAEARISSRLNHPNIVQLYELGRVGDEYYLAMELVDGVDLVRLLNACVLQRRMLPLALACHVLGELARALAYAHDLADNEGRPLAIVHRDVTPSNVMVTRAGGVKLLDFGVAKAAEHVRDDRTRTGTLKGKVNYLSPENAEGLPVDRRADIFALGIVFHECLTLRRLFKGEGDLQTLRLIREAKVAAPSTVRPEVPPELDRVVLRMLARDPAERYPDCHQLLADLLPIARALGGGAAELARLVSEVPAEPPSELGSDDDMDAGATPAIEVVNLLAPPAPPPMTAAPAPAVARPKWLWLALVAGGVLPALSIAVLVGRHHSPAVAAPNRPTATVAPPAAARMAPPVEPAAPAPAWLVVDTDVASARFALDGKVVADHVARARIAVARAGTHQLTVVAPRRKPLSRTVDVAAGATVELEVNLERRRAKPRRGEDYLVNPFGR